jgi:cobalt-precorrin-5B (C1)-methyltransferase
MDDHADPDLRPPGPLRHGWTTGACATAAAKAAFSALLHGEFPDPVTITLPKGQTPCFALACHALGDGEAMAGIVKDAGDDPDVTHGALVKASVRRGRPGFGVSFAAGEGVGTVTRPGLPLAVGEPAINPGPRAMIRGAIEAVAAEAGVGADAAVTIAIANGEALAKRTLNGRLGIVGGLSVLGTTGIVVPYSCSAWIHSIHRGIDVARAAGLAHVAGATGASSEAAVQRLYALPETALIDMGDFVGGMLKYLHKRPVPRVTIAGGFAKMTKLGQGLLDLHSRAGAVDLAWLCRDAAALGGDEAVLAAIAQAASAGEALLICERAGLAIATAVAEAAQRSAARLVAGTGMTLDVAVFDRDGRLLARAGDGR